MDRDIDAILESPVFVVGAPRSGTTWAQRLLLSHPAICGGQESHFFMAFGPIVEAYHRQRPTSRKGRQVGLSCYLDSDAFRNEIQGIWKRAFRAIVQAKPSATLLLEKTPDHAMQIRNILQVLPTARFIHVIRDSRAVVASLLAARKDGWGESWAPRSARDAAILWFRYVHTARREAALLPEGSYTEVHYEDLKRDTAGELVRLLGHLGLEANAGLVEAAIADQDFARQKRLGGTPLASPRAGERAEPPGFFRRGEVDGWQRDLNLPQKAIVWRFSRRLMRELGYSWKGRIPNPGTPGNNPRPSAVPTTGAFS